MIEQECDRNVIQMYLFFNRRQTTYRYVIYLRTLKANIVSRDTIATMRLSTHDTCLLDRIQRLYIIGYLEHCVSGCFPVSVGEHTGLLEVIGGIARSSGGH